MSRTNIAFLQSAITGGGPPGSDKVPNVVFDPEEGYTPRTVFLSTTQTGAHIFYTKGQVGPPVPQPTHDGDNATGTTIRIGSYQGTVNTGSGNKQIKALAYEEGYLDSDITEGNYEQFTGQ